MGQRHLKKQRLYRSVHEPNGAWSLEISDEAAIDAGGEPNDPALREDMERINEHWRRRGKTPPPRRG